MNVYLAAPLFSEAERQFNEQLAVRVGLEHRVFLPQRDGRLLVDLVHSGANPNEAARQVFEHDLVAIRECDCVLAVLDGRTIDEGVAFEVGFAFASGKLCIGLQTDPRRLLPIGNNPMVECSLRTVSSSVEGLLAWLRS